MLEIDIPKKVSLLQKLLLALVLDHVREALSNSVKYFAKL